MPVPDFLTCSAAALGMFALLGGTRARADDRGRRAVTWEIRCDITDPERLPLANASVHLQLGASPGFWSAGHGVAIRTDARGHGVATFSSELAAGAVKRPTNFVDSLLRRKEATDELLLAADFTYAGIRLLSVYPLHRFRSDGTVMIEGVTLWAQDEHGAFVRRVPQDTSGGWLLPELNGFALNDPVYRLLSCRFDPDASDVAGTRWVLDCQFQRSPDPVRR